MNICPHASFDLYTLCRRLEVVCTSAVCTIRRVAYCSALIHAYTTTMMLLPFYNTRLVAYRYILK